MEYSCEAFMDFAYGEDGALEAFHPIKGIQNLFTKLIAAIQKLLNRIRGMRAVWIPKMHKDTFEKLLKVFDNTRIELNEMTKSKDFSEIDDLADGVHSIESSSEFGQFINMDTSIFGKNDYIKIENAKDAIITPLNQAISHMTDLKTETINSPEADNEMKKIASIVIKYHSLEVSFFSRVLKLHPPLTDPRNVNKLDGVGNATVHA